MANKQTKIIMSRFLTKTPCFGMELNLEHPKVPNKPRLLRCGKHKDFLILLFVFLMLIGSLSLVSGEHFWWHLFGDKVQFSHVVETSFLTPSDTIPNFCLGANIVNVRNGNWNDPGTWDLNRVPEIWDNVEIIPGTTVNYNIINTDSLKCLGIYGNLIFSNDASTKLVADNIIVMRGGYLEIGTRSAPIQSGVEAEIIISDVPVNLTLDPTQLGAALIVLGKLSVSGAPKSPTFVRLSQEAKVGNTILYLSEPVTGWKIGDRIILPDTDEYPSSTSYVSGHPKQEVLTITGIAADGKSVNVAPLKYDHIGARGNKRGIVTLDFLPHIANLDRNVIFSSSQGAITRGHIFFTERADINVRYAEFFALGRTRSDIDLDIVDSSRTDIEGRPVTNQIGRYSVHMHHMDGPVYDGRQYQFEIVGNAIENSPKGCVFVHRSSFGLIKDNVCFSVKGVGFYAEDGPELNNTFDHNIALNITAYPGFSLTGGSFLAHIDTGKKKGADGSGFYFRGPLNFVKNNVAVNMRDSYGFTYFTRRAGTKNVPSIPGIHPDVPLDLTSVPITQFENNEVYGSKLGLTIWEINQESEVNKGNRLSVVKDFKAWHNRQLTYFGYPVNNITFDGWTVRGNESRLRSQFSTGTSGWSSDDYITINNRIVNADIQGVRHGSGTPRFNARRGLNGSDVGFFIIENSFIRAYNSIGAGSMYNSNGAEDMSPKRTILKNVEIEAVTPNDGNPKKAFNILFGSGISKFHLSQIDEFLVYNTSIKGFGADIFLSSAQVFYPEQAPDWIPPVTGTDMGGTVTGGSPEAGLTNQQLWDKYNPDGTLKTNPSARGFATAGAIAPCNNTNMVQDTRGISWGKICVNNTGYTQGYVLVLSSEGLNCVDSDSDGYNFSSTGCGSSDCNDGNVAINPAATEICSDSLDNNCNGLIDLQESICQAPSLVITSPINNSALVSNTVTVRYSESGNLAEVNHTHLQLDAQVEVRDLDNDGVYVFNGVSDGAHIVKAFMARADHTQIGSAISVSFSVITTGSCLISDPNLRMNMPFDDGTANDLSAADNNGVVTGATWNATGKFGGAFSFDNSGDYITINDGDLLDFESVNEDFSVFAWVKTTTPADGDVIMQKMDAIGDGWRLILMTNGRVRAYINAVNAQSATSVNDGLWHHVGFIADRDGNLQIYVDGVASGAAVSIASQPMDVALQLGRIGAASYSATSFFDGSIDDVLIFSRILTISEINSLFNGNYCSGSICGNGIKEGTEQCDDGNTFNGDGCSSICQTEIPLCVLNDANWSSINAIEGQNVNVNVYGNNCDGKIVDFAVYEADTDGIDEPVNINPASVTFVNGIAQGAWTAEWQCDGNLGGICFFGNPEYYFVANLREDGAISISSVDKLNGLLVTEAASSTCGNGIVQGTEQCDDRNTNNGDGCSSICQVEQGYSCTGQPSTCASSPPEVESLDLISGVNLMPNSMQNVVINFTINDNDNDINSTSATASFIRTGEQTRFNSSCVLIASNGNRRIFECTMGMQFYDAPGTWNVNISASDSLGNRVFNATATFNVNLLIDLSLDSYSIAFGNVVQGNSNITAALPTTIANRGNHEGPVIFRAYNLHGDVNPAESINADLFRAHVNEVDACTTGTILANGTAVEISGSVLPRGISANEQIYHCLTSVPSIGSQQYRTLSGYGWSISIL